MTETQAIEITEELTESLAIGITTIGKFRGEYEAAGSLFVVIANYVGNISPERWAVLTQEARRPCDIKGCNCHEVRGEFFNALDKVRQDHRKHAPAETRMRGQRN